MKKLTKEQSAELMKAHSVVLAAKGSLCASFRVGSNTLGGARPAVSSEEREAMRAELEAARAALADLQARYGVAQ